MQQLRATLSQQLAEPTLVAGNMLRGRSYGPLTSQIAVSLNSGQIVLPSSAYLNMMRHEVHEREMRESIERWLAELEAHRRAVVGGSHIQASPPTATATTYPLYTKRSIAIYTMEGIVQEIDSKYGAIVAESVGGGSCSNDVTTTIMSEYDQSTSQIKANVIKHFVASYDQQYHQNRQYAISTSVSDARNHLTVLLASFDTAKIWTTDDDSEMSLEMRRHALHSCLMKMTYHLKTTIIALVREWFDSMTADEQRSFESRIDDQFADPVTAFEDAAMIIEAVGS